MNSNRQFDEHIKDQFSNYTPDVHPRIWEKIIAKKNKKRPDRNPARLNPISYEKPAFERSMLFDYCTKRKFIYFLTP